MTLPCCVVISEASGYSSTRAADFVRCSSSSSLTIFASVIIGQNLVQHNILLTVHQCFSYNRAVKTKRWSLSLRAVNHSPLNHRCQHQHCYIVSLLLISSGKMEPLICSKNKKMEPLHPVLCLHCIMHHLLMCTQLLEQKDVPIMHH